MGTRWCITGFVLGERPREHWCVHTPDWEYGPDRDRRGVTDGTRNLVTSHVRVNVSPRSFPARAWFMLGA